MNTKIILELSKFAVATLTTSGINKIVKWGIESIKPENISKYDQIAVTVASTAIGITVSDIVTSHTDKYIDELPETFRKAKFTTMTVGEYLKTGTI